MSFGKLFSTISVALLASLSVQAADVKLTEGQAAALPDCGGEVSLERYAGRLFLTFEGATCSNVGLAGERTTKLQGENNEKGREFELTGETTGYNYWTVVIVSNSGKTSDSVSIRTFKAPASTYLSAFNTTTDLGACGGTVEMKISGGQANLIFRDVKNCSNFDILDANGDETEYKAHKIGTQESRNGSFTIPRSLYETGMNSVRVVVKSNSGKTRQEVLVYFLAW